MEVSTTMYLPKYIYIVPWYFWSKYGKISLKFKFLSVLKIMVELCLFEATRWFFWTKRNLGQSQSEYFADVSTFFLLFSHIFSNQCL